MTDTGIAGGLRETLEQGQRKATTCQTVPWFSSEEKYHNAFLALEDAITSALTQLEALERDHEAQKLAAVELMIPVEVLVSAYPETPPVGVTFAIWDRIREAMDEARPVILGGENDGTS